jgi:iron complex transport system substrate-binding protein
MKKFLFIFILFFSLTLKAKQRIIITSPELAEIIYILDGSTHIVGITKECDYPPQIRNIDKVGNFSSLNYEKIIKLNPTLIFTSSLEQSQTATKLQHFGFKVVQIYPNDLKSLESSITEIGNLIDRKEKADSLSNYITESINNFGYNQKNRPRIFLEIYGNPLMTVSDNSFVGQLIKLAGGENVFPKLPRDYCRISSEKVIAVNPDIIITTYPGITSKYIKRRMGWSSINAIKNNRIYTIKNINPDLILRAGPRIIDGIKALHKVIYEK